MANHRTVDSFTAAVQKRIENEMPKAAEKVVRKVSLLAYRLLIQKSPVARGTFRANWYPAVNALPTQVDDNLTTAPQRPTPAFKLGDMIVHGNNLPYAKRIETGWSKQAPQGVVGPVKRRLVNLLRAKKI